MPIGFRQGLCFDSTRSNWAGTGQRPLAWSAWYPAADDALAAVPEASSWFKASPIAVNAPMRAADEPARLVLISHGSGGTAASLEWLGHRLAQRGHVALALDHHGHTGTEPYRPEGFLALWERARDFSVLLDDPSWRQALGGPISKNAVIAGYSAGAYTALLLMGARVAFSQFEPDNPLTSPIRGPREFPDLADHLPRLLEDPIFAASWDRRRQTYRDPRVLGAIAIAPGRSVLGLAPESFEAIMGPVELFGGDADDIAPPDPCCTVPHEAIFTASLQIFAGVGHYAFLGEPTAHGRAQGGSLFTEADEALRPLVHDHVASQAADLADASF